VAELTLALVPSESTATDPDVFRDAVRVSWLVPKRSNDGREFSAADFADLERNVEKVTRALSRRENHVLGSWQSGHHAYRDASREYFVDVRDQELANELGVAIYQYIVHHFGQLAVSITLSSIRSTLFTPPEEIIQAPSRFAWRHTSTVTRRWFPVLALLITLFFSSCDRARGVGEAVGILNRSPGTPPTIDLLLDSGGGSPATPETTDALVADVVGQYASLPGTTVRCWWLSNDATSPLLGTFVVTASPKPSARAVTEHERELRTSATVFFHAVAAPYFVSFHRTRSPIIDGLASVSLAGSATAGEHIVLLLTDLLEHSRLGSLDTCGSPPVGHLVQRVRQVLPPGSLQGVTVYAVLSQPSRQHRCAVPAERFRVIADVFAKAIGNAGGRFVLSSTSFPVLRKAVR
jgi:hypothetical protein